MQLDSSSFRDFIKAFEQLPEEERREAIALAEQECKGMHFVPNPGPQTLAYYSPADELYFGGAAGPGKTTFLCGLAVNEHFDVQLFRRESTQLRGLVKELTKILGSSAGLNAQLGVWRLPTGQTIELAGVKDEADKEKWQGRAADLKGFDEICHFSRSQYRFIIGWNRSTRPGQRCRVVATGNPPLTVEGLWVIKHWAAWLDPRHPNPAKPGELRWPVRATDEDDENEIFFNTKEEAIEHLKTLRSAPRDYDGNVIPPRSRTFIPGELSDNPDLMRGGYSAVIEAMPKEVREAMRGDFTTGLKDDDWQVIPTAWLEAAQQRWTPKPPDGYAMTALAVDVAPGGGDKRVVAARYGGWFPKLDVAREEDKDGRLTASAVVKVRRDNCPVVVDLGGGWGGDAVIALKDNGIEVVTYMGLNPSSATTRDGKLRFVNLRAECIWKLREALDPGQEGGSVIALPPDDAELKADLASFRWMLKPNGIQIESKEDIKKRIGRSPDRGEAVVMCLAPGDRAVRRALTRRAPPKVILAYANAKKRR